MGRSGLHCGDDVLPRRAVEKALRSPGNWLYDEFFDTEALRRQGRDSLSIRDFFRNAEGLEIDISVQPFSLRKDLDFPCVVFRARSPDEQRGFCFFKERKRWVLSDFSGC